MVQSVGEAVPCTYMAVAVTTNINFKNSVKGVTRSYETGAPKSFNKVGKELRVRDDLRNDVEKPEADTCADDHSLRNPVRTHHIQK